MKITVSFPTDPLWPLLGSEEEPPETPPGEKRTFNNFTEAMWFLLQVPEEDYTEFEPQDEEFNKSLLTLFYADDIQALEIEKHFDENEHPYTAEEKNALFIDSQGGPLWANKEWTCPCPLVVVASYYEGADKIPTGNVIVIDNTDDRALVRSLAAAGATTLVEEYDDEE